MEMSWLICIFAPDMAGIYIHVPFCKSRCIYCDFYSQTSLDLRQRYVDAVCKEMEMRSWRKEEGERSKEKGVRRKDIQTIYLGGGTPSLLTEAQLQQLFIYINKVYVMEKGGRSKKEGGGRKEDGERRMEVTIECNPDDVTEAFAEMLSHLPVNRISMGAQTFSDGRLQFLRRRHQAAQVPLAVERLRKAGFTNISIDLMYGFPGETLEEWQADIDQALALQVEHLSAYALQYEEGTPLYRMLQRGEVKETDEELSRQMYYMLKDRLAAAGYEHYEISNFARKGFRSRHNSSYWNQTPYIGLGAAAHSYDGVNRQWNVLDIRRYMEGIEKGEPVVEHEILTPDNRYNEVVMTALRTCEGLQTDSLPAVYRNHCLEQSQRYIASGLLVHDKGHLRLTREGLFVSDMVIVGLLRV